jgi:hypothetical protein
MMLTLMLLRIAAATALTAQLPVAPPRDQPRSTRSDASETATIRGLVTDRETGAPVSGVLVLVVPVTAEGDMIFTAPDQRRRTQYSRRTGSDGSYEIAGVLPGSYRVTFIPSDVPALHLTQNFGDEGPVTPLRARPAARLTLGAGQTKNDVSAALSRGLAIEGRVIDERGEPVANADVVASVADGPAYVGMAGRPRSTDDRGAFRVFGLSAGAYRVCAHPGPESLPTVGNADRLVGACHPEEGGSGRAVTLTSKDVSGVVIQLRRSRTFTIRGFAADSSGTPIERGYLNLISAAATPMSPSWSIEFTGGGSFTGRSIPPGDYVLLVWQEGRPDVRDRETGYLPLRVDAADVDGLIVTTTNAGRVRGRIVVDGTAVLRPATLRVTSELDRRMLPVSLIPGQGAIVGDDFSFEMLELWGPRLLQVSGLPKGWIVKAVLYRGQDVTDMGVEFRTSEEAKPIEVVVTTHAGSITGRVAGAEGAKPDAFVVAVSGDPKRRRAVPTVVHTPVREDQTFDSGAIRPGDYIVAAVDPLFAGLLTGGDRDALNRLVEAGTRLTVRADERLSQDLRVLTLR